MKTTLELPDDLFQAATRAAEANGVPLRDLVSEALRDKLGGAPKGLERTDEPPWMQFYGSFGGSSTDRQETWRIQQRIDAEFGHPDALE